MVNMGTNTSMMTATRTSMGKSLLQDPQMNTALPNQPKGRIQRTRKVTV
jgi:hypothetical protein